MHDIFRNGVAFLAILNPFALCLYLMGAMDDLNAKTFFRVLFQASLVSYLVFILFAWLGESFLLALRVDPSALRLFGGLIFLAIAYKYVSTGYRAVEMLRGSLEELPSTIAVPFMIGAGTITQAILIGKKHDMLLSSTILLTTLVVSFGIVAVFYVIRMALRKKLERVFERYVNMLARINGLLIGAISVSMIVDGIVGLMQKQGLII